jgi:hypothetical protein
LRRAVRSGAGLKPSLVYDNGVFKPQGPVPAAVKNHAVVHVVIVDEAEGANVAVAERWKAIDRLTGLADDEGGPTDVAQNPRTSTTSASRRTPTR